MCMRIKGNKISRFELERLIVTCQLNANYIPQENTYEPLFATLNACVKSDTMNCANTSTSALPLL